MPKRPEYVDASNSKDYFKKGKGLGFSADKGANQYQNNLELNDEYSYVAHQDAPDAVGYHQDKTAKKGGGFDLGEKRMIYKKVKEKKAEAPKPDASIPTPVEEKPDDLVIKPVEHSQEIQDAKSRVKAYKETKLHSVYNPDTPAQKNFAQAESLDLSKYQFNAGS